MTVALDVENDKKKFKSECWVFNFEFLNFLIENLKK